MGFGRNPHVAKAEAAQAKAREATDVASEVRAYLEAAHLWDRAAAKELELAAGRRGGGASTRHAEYEANAAAARERSSAATQKQTPSPAALAAQLKVLRGGRADDSGEP